MSGDAEMIEGSNNNVYSRKVAMMRSATELNTVPSPAGIVERMSRSG